MASGVRLDPKPAVSQPLSHDPLHWHKIDLGPKRDAFGIYSVG